MTIYLDHAATTPLDARVRAAMEPFLGAEFGNPSSRHPLGVRAAEALEAARAKLARALVVPARNVVFTSGGSEAASLAVLGVARAAKGRGRHVLIGATEHACVRESAARLAREGFEVERARLDASGAIDLEHFASALRPDTLLVAQMLVQNELGTVYPIARIAKLVRARSPRALLAVDAVQAFGKLDCAAPELGADLLWTSAHKIHGPKGAGALAWMRDVAIEPLAYGGGQEHGLRPGTQNVAAIVGFGAAAELAEQERDQRLEHARALRARLLEGLAELRGARVLAAGDELLPTVISIAIDGAPAEVRMHHLERHGVYVSTGSACQASKQGLSPALAALGLSDEEQKGVLRISTASTTTFEEIDAAVRALIAVSRELEAVSR